MDHFLESMKEILIKHAWHKPREETVTPDSVMAQYLCPYDAVLAGEEAVKMLAEIRKRFERMGIKVDLNLKDLFVDEITVGQCAERIREKARIRDEYESERSLAGGGNAMDEIEYRIARIVGRTAVPTCDPAYIDVQEHVGGRLADIGLAVCIQLRDRCEMLNEEFRKDGIELDLNEADICSQGLSIAKLAEGVRNLMAEKEAVGRGEMSPDGVQRRIAKALSDLQDKWHGQVTADTNVADYLGCDDPVASCVIWTTAQEALGEEFAEEGVALDLAGFVGKDRNATFGHLAEHIRGLVASGREAHPDKV